MCDILAQYRGMLAYLHYVGKPNPNARWSKREARYIRHHPKLDRRMGSLDIMRHPRRGFETKVKRMRDHRRGLAKGGGPNFCKTLTLSRLLESSVFKADLFTAYHRVRWCYDEHQVYRYHADMWTEIDVHDHIVIDVSGEVDSHRERFPLPHDTGWYTYQQYKIGNCVMKFGCLGHWYPTWRVWAAEDGMYDWDASW
jgi:hypothetical protein